MGCEKETEVQDDSRIFDPVIRIEFLSNKIKKAFCRVDFVEGERLAHYITVELTMPINFPGCVGIWKCECGFQKGGLDRRQTFGNQWQMDCI